MKLQIQGKKKIQGTIKISGSKNSALAIIASSILTDEEVTIRNVPEISDIMFQIHILEEHGYTTYFKDNVLKISPPKKVNSVFLSNNISKIRGSYYFMGASLAKNKKIKIRNCGGCDLGKRPINYHLKAFEMMNVKIKENSQCLSLKTLNLKAAVITLPFPSVGATINTMIASTLAKGTTIIKNAALEPEVSDVGNFLISMGAKIDGLSTSTIKITGVNKLHGTDYIISSDRIEAGTYLILGVLSNGEKVILENVEPYYIKSLIDCLKNAGAKITTGNHSITICGSNKLKPLNITIGPYPSFPTDLGPIISVLMTQIEGTSTITETIFENRFSHVNELKALDASLEIKDKTLIVEGKTKLKGNDVCAYDLRCAASLLIATIIASGKSTINNIEYLLRGYEKPIEKLSSLGIKANIVV